MEYSVALMGVTSERRLNTQNRTIEVIAREVKMRNHVPTNNIQGHSMRKLEIFTK